MSDALRRPLPPSVFARLGDAARYVITGVSPDTWFGPLQPLQPMAPPEVKGRRWDYPFGANLNYIPRADDGVSFAELRGLADALPLLRAVIETRKDQIAAQSFAIRPRDRKDSPAAAQAIQTVTRFLARPDRRHSFADWLRMLLEDMLVIDAATLYPRFNRGGSLYALDVIDGATIKPLIGEDGRAPEPPDPAYQQILKGIPAADFSVEELLYLPRNVRAHRLYGMSPVEQIALTVNIALRRDAATLDYYRAGSTPDAFATLPKEWTADQIRSFQDYFDALMSGNLARRRQTKFMPADFKLIEARQPPLKDQYDEWLARLICYAFSVPVSAFVSQVNRATGETLRQQAAQEGLIPLKAWVKNALDHVICICMNEPSLEFVWVGDDAVDPLEQAQTLQILVGAGIKTREEARADLGLAPAGGAAPEPPVAKRGTTRALLGKFNPHHDERGLFATADNAAGPVGSAARKPRPTRVQVASLDVMSDVDALDVAQAEPIEPPEPLRPAQGVEPPKTQPSSSVSPAETEPVTTANSPGARSSRDEDNGFEFGSTQAPRFASERLSEHFAEHGSDFGATTEAEYEQQAAQFLTDDNPQILEFTRKKGYRQGDTVRSILPRMNSGLLPATGRFERTIALIQKSTASRLTSTISTPKRSNPMNRCPVCGYDGLDEPAFDDVGAPSYDICDCCGTQFGYHDARTPHAVLREKWVAKGMPWHSRTTPPPPGWNPLEQLRSVINQPESASDS